MKKRNVSLVRSETWMRDNFNVINDILEQTIEDFIDNERIVNIEVKEHNGLNRFWIYIEDKKKD